MGRDLRIALRSLFRRPGFTAVAVITLAVGTGGNTAIFSTVNAVLLQDLPYPEPQEIYSLGTAMTDGRSTTGTVSAAELTRLNESDVISYASATFRSDGVLLDLESNPIRATIYAVFPWYFEVFGLPMTLGRSFTFEEHAVGGPQLAILAYDIWENVYGADPNIIGDAVRIQGGSRVVVGVAPRGFKFPDDADAWTNMQSPPLGTGHGFDGWIRVRPDIDQPTLQTRLEPVAEALAEDFPAANRGRIFEVHPLLEAIIGDLGSTLVVLFGATAILLLIACVNVTNLLLSRGASRARDIALRVAVGASRGSIVRQLLTESMVLAAMGAIGGLALAAGGVRLLLAIGARDLPRLSSVPIDATVLLFAVGTAALIGLLVGFAPALRLAGTDLKTLVNEGGRGNSGGPSQARLFNTLVVTEVGLAVVLVIGAGLLVRSFSSLRATDPGLVPDRVILFDLQLPQASYPDYERVADFYRDLQDRVRPANGVEAVSSASTVPFASETDFMINTKRQDEPMPEVGQEVRARFRQVSPGYFATLNIRLMEGRTFEPRDRRDGAPVAVVNEEFVRQFFPEGSPIGRRIEIITPAFVPGGAGYAIGSRPDSAMEIVGIVENTKYVSLREPPEPTFYAPQDQAPFRRQAILVRTSGVDPTGVATTVRNELRQMDPQLPIEMTLLEQLVDASMATDRMSMVLLGMFGAAALLLAGVGIYGVIAYAVVQRTGELAIRTALGATPPSIRTLILREGLRLGIIGVVVGLIGAAVAGRVVASQLYEVSALDPVVFMAVPIVLLAIALIATAIPALRAMRIDPVIMLRSE